MHDARTSPMRRGVLLLLLCAAAAMARADVQRIISLTPSVTETLFALGLGAKLVGVSTYCDYPPEARKIDRVGTFLTPNVEAIVAKHPDLVIAVPSPGNQNPVETLRRLGLQVLIVDPNAVAEIEESTVTIGRAVGHDAEARALVTRIEQGIAAIRARLDEVPPRTVLMVVGHTPLIAAGGRTLQDELIRLAHGTNIAAAAGSLWPHLSIEFALAAAPDVIIDTTMGNEDVSGAAAAQAFWQDFPTIPAVRTGRVCGYRQIELLRPGPRVVEALQTIARCIHPEALEAMGSLAH